MRRVLTSLVLSLLAFCSHAGDEFDFRGAERPVYDQAVTVDELREERQKSDVTILDVRLVEDFEADPQLIPGATYKNPEEIEAWASTLPSDVKVVVYCVRGKWVSHKAADILSREGLDVYTLEGGIEAWKTAND